MQFVNLSKFYTLWILSYNVAAFRKNALLSDLSKMTQNIIFCMSSNIFVLYGSIIQLAAGSKSSNRFLQLFKHTFCNIFKQAVGHRPSALVL